MKRPLLTDAQEMARLHPATFSAPSPDDLSRVKPGDYVKVCSWAKNLTGRTERFWVEVLAVSDSGIVGRIDNDLVFTNLHGLEYDDRIEFEARHIYACAPPVVHAMPKTVQ